MKMKLEVYFILDKMHFINGRKLHSYQGGTWEIYLDSYDQYYHFMLVMLLIKSCGGNVCNVDYSPLPEWDKSEPWIPTMSGRNQCHFMVSEKQYMILKDMNDNNIVEVLENLGRITDKFWDIYILNCWDRNKFNLPRKTSYEELMKKIPELLQTQPYDKD